MFNELASKALYRCRMSDKQTVQAFPILKHCGVYAIYHAASGKIYIGSTADLGGFKYRWAAHKGGLKKGTHWNPHLQAYYNKYGPEAFEFLILELTERPDARPREMWYLETHKPWAGGFNYTQVANQRWTFKTSEATKAKLSTYNAKPFKLQFEGKIYEGVNLTAFSKERGLHQGAMTQVLLGNKLQFKGWTLPGVVLPSYCLKNHKTGEIITIPYFGIAAWAKKMKLPNPCVRSLLSGRSKLYKGWGLPDTVISIEEAELSISRDKVSAWRSNIAKATAAWRRPCKLQKNGVIYEAESQSQFARDHGINGTSSINLLIKGKIKQTHGFSLVPE